MFVRQKDGKNDFLRPRQQQIICNTFRFHEWPSAVFSGLECGNYQNRLEAVIKFIEWLELCNRWVKSFLSQ